MNHAARRLRPAPNLALSCVATLCLLAGLLAVVGAVRAPWIDVRLSAASDGTVRATVGHGEPEILRAVASAGDPRLALEPRALDLTEEPDMLGSYAEIAALLDRQSRLAAILSAPTVSLTLESPGGTRRQVELSSGPRPISDLPATFWVQLVTGVGGLLIGGWVWALRLADWGARLLVMSGAGLMLSALAAAVYGTRLIALDGDLLRVLMIVNHVGAHLFGGAVIALFLVYPMRLVAPRWLLVIPLVIAPLVVADALRVGISPPVFYLAIALEMLVIVILIVLQGWATRHDPRARAALLWLGLSVIVGAGSWTLIAAAPLVFGGEASVPQGYSFGLFLLIYVGLALGVSRYRLFELGEWAFRVLFITLGTLIMVAVDAALVLAVHIERAPALGLSLLMVGFLYLPLRDALWRRLTRRRRLEDHELFGAVIEVAFAPTFTARAAHWRALVERLFDPLEIAAASAPVAQPAIEQSGLVLLLPASAGMPALRVAYPWGGRGLFGPSQLQTARRLVDLLVQAENSREAYERGVTEERRRMAQDLHDDVGARLLSGLHTADAPTRPVLHAALADIRAIVSGLVGDTATLDRVLAEVRHEAARRLEAAGIALDWPPYEASEADVMLDYRTRKALTSAVREVVSNVIRHSGAGRVRATVARQPDRLIVTLADDGRGLPETAHADGQGLRNLRRRIADIRGALTIASPGTGTQIRFEVPLAATGVAATAGLPKGAGA